MTKEKVEVLGYSKAKLADLYINAMKGKKETNAEHYAVEIAEALANEKCIQGKASFIAKYISRICANDIDELSDWLVDEYEEEATFEITRFEYDLLQECNSIKDRTSARIFLNRFRDKGYFSSISDDEWYDHTLNELLGMCEVA